MPTQIEQQVQLYGAIERFLAAAGNTPKSTVDMLGDGAISSLTNSTQLAQIMHHLTKRADRPVVRHQITVPGAPTVRFGYTLSPRSRIEYFGRGRPAKAPKRNGITVGGQAVVVPITSAPKRKRRRVTETADRAVDVAIDWGLDMLTGQALVNIYRFSETGKTAYLDRAQEYLQQRIDRNKQAA